MSALRSPAATSASTSLSRTVSPPALARVVRRGPRGTSRPPSRRRRCDTTVAAARAPSASSSEYAVRRASSVPMSARASAASYGRPHSVHASAAFRAVARELEPERARACGERRLVDARASPPGLELDDVVGGSGSSRDVEGAFGGGAGSRGVSAKPAPPPRLRRRPGTSSELTGVIREPPRVVDQVRDVGVAPARAHPGQHRERQRGRERRDGAATEHDARGLRRVRPAALVQLDEGALGDEVQLDQLDAVGIAVLEPSVDLAEREERLGGDRLEPALLGERARPQHRLRSRARGRRRYSHRPRAKSACATAAGSSVRAASSWARVAHSCAADSLRRANGRGTTASRRHARAPGRPGATRGRRSPRSPPAGPPHRGRDTRVCSRGS